MRSIGREVGSVCAAVAVLALAGGVARAQQAQPPARPAERVLELKDFQGMGPRAKVKTPEYSTNMSGRRVPPREWARLLVEYDTFPEWLDEVTFQYYALLYKEEKGKAQYTLFKGAVTYVDVPQARRHLSVAYLRPSTLARYGDVVGAAVEILNGGAVVASQSEQGKGIPRDQEWWKSPNLTVKEGYILNHLQTPFAHIAYDDYDTVK